MSLGGSKLVGFIESLPQGELPFWRQGDYIPGCNRDWACFGARRFLMLRLPFLRHRLTVKAEMPNRL